MRCRSDLLGLGEEVGKEDLVVLALGNRVEGLRWGEEVAAVSDAAAIALTKE